MKTTVKLHKTTLALSSKQPN